MSDILHTPMPEADCIAYERMTGVVNILRGHVMAAREMETLMAQTTLAAQYRVGREIAEDMLRNALLLAGAKVEE